MKCPTCGAVLPPNSLKCRKCQKMQSQDVSESCQSQNLAGCTNPLSKTDNKIARHHKATSKKEGAAYKLLGAVQKFESAHSDGTKTSRTLLSGGIHFPHLSDKPEPKQEKKQCAGYLLCPPSPPAALVKDQYFTIGRDEGNSFVLPSQGVSRFHSRIRWESDGFLVEDLGSSNGTKLNNEYVTRQELRDGDRIHIGEYTLFFREATKGKPLQLSASKNALEKTIKITRKDVSGKIHTREKQDSFNGDIRSIGLFAILQILGMDAKTGCLLLRGPLGEAKIYLQEGIIIHSEYGEFSGLEAFFSSMAFEDGQFSFDSDASPNQSSMGHEVDMLLLEYARQMDENSR